MKAVSLTIASLNFRIGGKVYCLFYSSTQAGDDISSEILVDTMDHVHFVTDDRSFHNHHCTNLMSYILTLVKLNRSFPASFPGRQQPEPLLTDVLGEVIS